MCPDGALMMKEQFLISCWSLPTNRTFSSWTKEITYKSKLIDFKGKNMIKILFSLQTWNCHRWFNHSMGRSGRSLEVRKVGQVFHSGHHHQSQRRIYRVLPVPWDWFISSETQRWLWIRHKTPVQLHSTKDQLQCISKRFDRFGQLFILRDIFIA